jgi:uncharacterized membrane protein (GlpM family)
MSNRDRRPMHSDTEHSIREALRDLGRALLSKTNLRRYYDPDQLPLFLLSLGFVGFSILATYQGIENAEKALGFSLGMLGIVAYLAYLQEQTWRGEHSKPTHSDVGNLLSSLRTEDAEDVEDVEHVESPEPEQGENTWP